eukprot:387450-Hanusia_phi.AAC.1
MPQRSQDREEGKSLWRPELSCRVLGVWGAENKDGSTQFKIGTTRDRCLTGGPSASRVASLDHN